MLRCQLETKAYRNYHNPVKVQTFLKFKPVLKNEENKLKGTRNTLGAENGGCYLIPYDLQRFTSGRRKQKKSTHSLPN